MRSRRKRTWNVVMVGVAMMGRRRCWSGSWWSLRWLLEEGRCHRGKSWRWRGDPLELTLRSTYCVFCGGFWGNGNELCGLLRTMLMAMTVCVYDMITCNED